MLKNKFLYAIKISELITTGIKIINVKIGQTNDIYSTLNQYKRSNPEAEILDLWQPNPAFSNANQSEKGLHILAEKYAYDRKKETFIFLQETYQKFRENVNLLLKNITIKTNKPKGNFNIYSNTKPILLKFKQKEFQVKSWRDVLLKISSEIIKEKKDFSPALKIKGTKRIYFSEDKNKLVVPLQIGNSNYFCEGYLSANSIVNLTKKLLKVFGYNTKDLEIKYE